MTSSTLTKYASHHSLQAALAAYDTRQLMRPYQVQAANVADFLERYYKGSLLVGNRAVLLTAYSQDIEREGFTFIPACYSTQRRTVSWYGKGYERTDQ